MVEKLLSISEVHLYGEKVDDMKYIDPPGKDPKNPNIKCFVRVFGYGFESDYYSLDAPIIMLLDKDKEAELSKKNTPEDVIKSFPTDIRAWIIDKSDRSVRLDELTGTIEEILLEVELGGGGGASGSY